MRALTVTALVLLLSGCVGSPPPNAATPTPSVTPVFATEEEALAAAEAAYTRYLEVSDAIGADGGANPERIEPLVTQDWYEKELDVSLTIQKAAIQQVGATAFSFVEIQSYSDSDGIANISIYTCVDFTNTWFVDSTNQRVSPERPDIVSMLLSFEATGPQRLLLSGSEPWSDFFC